MLDPLSFKTIEDEDESFDFEQEEESSEEFNLEFDENSTNAIPKVDSESECSSESESDGSDEENEFNGEKDGVIEIEEEERKIIEQEDILKIKKMEKRKKEYFEEVESNEIDAFTSLSLSRPILKAVASMGYTKPTAIQSQAIPVALQGRDICGSAVTGSGKTAAFMIPILERLLFRPKSFAAIRVLVLVPTRELGSQCHEVTMNLSKFSEISVCLCVGGLSNKSQEVELKKKPDIVIATPGRLIDHIHNSSSFSLDQLEILVIDEADRILEDGFKDELDEIIKHTPRKRQTMLFSATMTDNVDELIKLSLTRPVRLFVDDSAKMTNKLVQEFIRVRSHREDTRPAILVSLCTRTYRKETIIFFRSKAAAHHMKIIFELMGMKAAELHGNLTQPQRMESLKSFKEKKVNFLLCTDVASRGLDITGVKTVINYDMPNTYQVYVHRCGRTARGSASGRAVSLVGENDRQILKLALKNSQDAVKHRVLPTKTIQLFEQKVKELEIPIKERYAQEKEEKALQQAEMELTKAQNRITYEDEIKSRPAKVWFQPAKETKKVDSNPKKEINRNKLDGMSRKKKRLYYARMEDKQGAAKQSIAAKHSKTFSKTERLSKFKKDAPKFEKPKSKKRKTFSEEMRA